jgi:hypothetical protein
VATGRRAGTKVAATGRILLATGKAFLTAGMAFLVSQLLECTSALEKEVESRVVVDISKGFILYGNIIILYCFQFSFHKQFLNSRLLLLNW